MITITVAFSTFFAVLTIITTTVSAVTGRCYPLTHLNQKYSLYHLQTIYIQLSNHSENVDLYKNIKISKLYSFCHSCAKVSIQKSYSKLKKKLYNEQKVQDTDTVNNSYVYLIVHSNISKDKLDENLLRCFINLIHMPKSISKTKYDTNSNLIVIQIVIVLKEIKAGIMLVSTLKVISEQLEIGSRIRGYGIHTSMHTSITNNFMSKIILFCNFMVVSVFYFHPLLRRWACRKPREDHLSTHGEVQAKNWDRRQEVDHHQWPRSSDNLERTNGKEDEEDEDRLRKEDLFLFFSLISDFYFLFCDVFNLFLSRFDRLDDLENFSTLSLVSLVNILCNRRHWCTYLINAPMYSLENKRRNKICHTKNTSRLVLVCYLEVSLGSSPTKQQSRDTSANWLCGQFLILKLIFKLNSFNQNLKPIQQLRLFDNLCYDNWDNHHYHCKLYLRNTTFYTDLNVNFYATPIQGQSPIKLDKRHKLCLLIIKIAHDIELNPGPPMQNIKKLEIYTLNCRGLGKTEKFRLMLHKRAHLLTLNQDSIFMLQETMVKNDN
jgi:hypothetical protein